MRRKRGKQPGKYKQATWSAALAILALAVCLSGCSSLMNGRTAAGIPEAAAEPATFAVMPALPSTESGGQAEPSQAAEERPLPSEAAPSLPPAAPSQPNKEERKLVALTFDDGPDNKYTTQILDLLQTLNVHATFFLVGQQVAKYPETVERIAEEGHSIGNHSWSHSDLTKLSDKDRSEQITKTQNAILAASGVIPQLMRAPYGAISKEVLKTIHEQDMQHVYWTVDTRDWAGTSVAVMHKNVLANTHQGGIILMHSFGGRKNALEHTVKLLPTIIKELREKGYEFATVDELIEAGQAHSSVVK